MISIKRTTVQDAEILTDLQKKAFLPLYEKYHDKGNPCLRGVEDILRRLDNPAFRYFTIYKNDEIVGGIFYKCEGETPLTGELKAGEYYLQRVYIKPEYQCKGIAQRAILMCEETFTDAKVFYVDFPESLEKNRRCYEKAGYKDTGKRLEVEPGLVLAAMKKKVKNND